MKKLIVSSIWIVFLCYWLFSIITSLFPKSLSQFQANQIYRSTAPLGYKMFTDKIPAKNHIIFEVYRDSSKHIVYLDSMRPKLNFGVTSRYLNLVFKSQMNTSVNLNYFNQLNHIPIDISTYKSNKQKLSSLLKFAFYNYPNLANSDSIHIKYYYKVAPQNKLNPFMDSVFTYSNYSKYERK